MSNNEKTIFQNKEIDSPINHQIQIQRVKTQTTIVSTPQKNFESQTQLSNNIQGKISPLTPQLKYKNYLEKKELNHKFFPSKETVCRGKNSSKSINLNQQNSPIVQYYSNSNFERFSTSSDNNLVLDNNQNIYMKNRESNFSTNSQNFNYSPSNIFNNKSNPNTPLIGMNNNTPLLSKSSTPYLINGMIKRSLQEKIEENDNFAIESDDDDPEKNEDLYRLSFNSDDKDKNDDNNICDSKDKESFNLPIQSAINKAIQKQNQRLSQKIKDEEDNKNENQSLNKNDNIKSIFK